MECYFEHCYHLTQFYGYHRKQGEGKTEYTAPQELWIALNTNQIKNCLEVKFTFTNPDLYTSCFASFCFGHPLSDFNEVFKQKAKSSSNHLETLSPSSPLPELICVTTVNTV